MPRRILSIEFALYVCINILKLFRLLFGFARGSRSTVGLPWCEPQAPIYFLTFYDTRYVIMTDWAHFARAVREAPDDAARVALHEELLSVVEEPELLDALPTAEVGTLYRLLKTLHTATDGGIEGPQGECLALDQSGPGGRRLRDRLQVFLFAEEDKEEPSLAHLLKSHFFIFQTTL